MRDFDIYKICENLSSFEISSGVLRVAPVWGHKMTPHEYYKYMLTRVESARRLLLPGELGCALAHIDVYKKICYAGRPAIILEDDVNLDDISLSKISATLKEIKLADFVHFAHYRHQFRKVEVKIGIYIADTSRGFWGAAAYFVSHRMAHQLLKSHEQFIELADNWQEFFTTRNYIPYYVPIFEHTGELTVIGNRRTISQNPSIMGSIKLRFLRKRMVYSASIRLWASVIKAQIHRFAAR